MPLLKLLPKLLGDPKSVPVLNANDDIVGVVHSSKVIHVLFGENSTLESNA